MTGTHSLGIAGDGVFLAEGASFNWIGVIPNGATDVGDEGNLISGNGNDGVHIVDTGTDDNVIAGNRIGTDVTGTVAVGNGGQGIEVDSGSVGNTIGGTAAGAGNVISGNQASGVWINADGATGNLIQGNLIGTDVTGSVALGNAYWGVILQEAANNTVGGLTAGAGNLISGNNQGGVAIRGIDAVGDVVQSNLIGTDITGTLALGNASSGVYVGDFGNSGDAASDATIGGTAAGAGNVISANGNWGVQISGEGATGNIIQGNSIGTDLTGTVALGNTLGGVLTDTGASENTIGGTTPAAGNLITGNGGPGVVVGVYVGGSVGDEVTANRIFGNTGQAIDLDDDGVTYNSFSPRSGPNNLQNFPIIVTTDDGQTEGWLGGSTPDTTFRIDVFASSAYSSDGSGEAEDFLGSLQVTTDATGQVIFNVPFAAPAALPNITATATDPLGNTSEVSALRRSTLAAPAQTLRSAPGQTTVFSNSSGDLIAVQDQDAQPLDPAWELALSASAGTVTLSSASGLTGLGDGTGSLTYSGALTAINAGLAGMRYTPPLGYQGIPTLSLDAESDGAASIQAQIHIVVTSGLFNVTSTADGGPGSLRQAILDSNTATGGTNTIDFAIPGTGVQAILLSSPLPPIAASVLIDGTTQPGFVGTSLIEIGGQPAVGAAALTIAASDVTVRGLVVDEFAFDTTTDEVLVAQVHPQGLTSRMSLLDSQGDVLVQSDGLSPTDPDDLIAQQLVSGSYFLKVENEGGAGNYSLTTTVAPTTAAFQPMPVGTNPDAMVAGDFTGDGHLDLAVANMLDNTVSVLLGNGDGTFQPQVTYAVGSDPDGIVAGDFTGNGHLDLAVANDANYGGPGTVSVLLGNGDGTFQPQVTYAVGSYPDAIVAGDFGGNGHLDLAVANMGSNDVSILMGNGDGTFQPLVTYAVGSGPDGIVSVDFNGDGRTDLAVADGGDSTVSVLLGNGNGTFQPHVTYEVGTDPSAVVAADFNGDGRLDLAVANEGSNNVSVLLGNGDGTFQPQVTYAAAVQPDAIVAGDFAGNGRIDLAVTNQLSGISVLLGNGDGTFQPQVKYPAGQSLNYGIVAGDFDGDRRIDLAVANSDYPNGSVSVLLGNGDGTFQGGLTNQVEANPSGIASGDFTGNGRTDLAVVNLDDNTVSVMLGNGDGTFQPQLTYAVGDGPLAIVAGDFNGDGRTDLAVANEDSNTVSVLLGNGDGTFQPQVAYAVGTAPYAIVAGDFTGDGRTDLAVANRADNTVSVLLGNGDGTFQPQVTYAVGSNPGAIVAGDFSGNGDVDLAVANGSGTVSVLLGNGNGTFQPQVTYAVGSQPDSIVAGDFNGDGKLDLAVGYSGDFVNPFGVSVLMGNGDGTFQPQVTYAVGFFPYAIAAGDFTGSGRTDLAVANDGDGTVSVLLGNGNGTFQPQVTYAVGSSPVSIVTGDFNGAWMFDLAVAGYLTSDVSILVGNGDGTFSDPGQFATTPLATPLVADVTGDGTDDVLVVDGAGNILYRQGVPGQPGSFAPPVTVNPGNPSRDIAWVQNTSGGPVLASVDAQDPAISLYAWRDGRFVPLGSLSTGELPAQIISADLNGNGFDDVVVRNAGDGTLTVFFGTPFIGPVGRGFIPVSFLAPVTLPVGLGVSDVEAVDTRGNGRLDLVVTNKLTGQVSVLPNLGDAVFAAPVPYRAGTGLSAVDPGGSPEVTSQEATAGVAAGTFTTGGPTDLVTINPGSNTLDVLAGLGDGLFANPVTIETSSPAEVVRVADFTGNGVDDLAVLTAAGVSIYLANGKGGFLPPVNYDAGTSPTGLTVADLNGNGKLDLLVGDVYGDVLILEGNGDGTFRPFEPVKAAIALAVADLTGNGVPDFIFADQSLNQVSVVYGTLSDSSNSPQVIGNQSSGVLAPGAVKLADLNGDGIPDLIVANSGGNNVLVYPGLPNGQFGPSVNGSTGFPVGTDPTGLTVANLNGQPDLLVADTGSNDVSVLLGQGSGSSWTLISGARVQTDAGPVAMVVGNLLGGSQTDLAVANSGANNVQVFPGDGGGFFSEKTQAIKTYPVGQDPLALFQGDFGPGLSLATLNGGSNDGTLLGNLNSTSPSIQTFATGGDFPVTGFAGNFSGNGFTDLVVGNNGDGHLALLLGGTDGLSLSQSFSNPAVPNPTAMSFGGVENGVLSFYVSTAGHEAALEMAFNLDGGATVVGAGFGASTGLSTAPGLTIVQISQFGGSSGSVLDLIASIVTFTVVPANLESELESAGGGTALLASFSPGGATGSGQSLGLPSANDDGALGEADVKNAAGTTDGSSPGQGSAAVDRLAPWARFAVGLDDAWQELRARVVGSERAMPAPTAGDDGAAPGAPRVRTQAPSRLTPDVDSSRSDTKSRSGLRDGTPALSPSRTDEPAPAATNGVWRHTPAAGERVSYRAGVLRVLAAVDRAIEELDGSVPRSSRLVRILPPAAVERSECPAYSMMEVVAASMALSMMREHAIQTARRRHQTSSDVSGLNNTL